ncbi:unnamed protein product [Acanthoscelides obtectus]|uniref:Uncharacterized protein n=1 Tax=Acanthoscelides obtectus TaxID=200917 RepID=A0A9P0NVJ4_ACAOB|nr:unnamed protein product [Acanthoscelides obtectus]CAK1639921.1 hypothetical protein AOBTE_LOCUS11452 [Acanthoscelides obtectus]
MWLQIWRCSNRCPLAFDCVRSLIGTSKRGSIWSGQDLLRF